MKTFFSILSLVLCVSGAQAQPGIREATAAEATAGTASAPYMSPRRVAGVAVAPNVSNATGTLPANHGGTGVANAGASTITLGGPLVFSGAYSFAGTLTGNTAITFPTTGTLATLAGSESLTNKTLTTPVLTGLPTGTGVASAATASTLVARDTNANDSANNFLPGYATTATAAGTTTLTVASAYYQAFTGSTTQTVVLPVVSTLTLGHRFEINNLSSGTVTVNSSGSNLVATLLAGERALFRCILTSGTTAASWDAALGGAVASVAPTANQTTVSTSNGVATVGIASNPTLTGNVTVTGNVSVGSAPLVITGTTGSQGITVTGTNQSFTITPSGTGATIVSGIGTGDAYANYLFQVSSTANEAGFSLVNTGAGGRSYSFLSTKTGSGIGAGKFVIADITSSAARLVIPSSGNVLLGGLTTDGTGVLQFPAATTSAGGIAFGTDMYFYRTLAGNVKFDGGTGNCAMTFNGGAANSQGFVFQQNGSEVGRITFPGTTSMVFAMGPGAATALTLDSAQNAQFAGTVKSSGFARVTADVTNATATMSNLTNLSVTVAAGVKYTGTIQIFGVDSTNTDGLAFDLGGGSATFTDLEFGFAAQPAGSTLGVVTSTTSTTAVTLTVVSTSDAVYTISFGFTCNAGGTFIPRFSQVVHSTGTATVRKNSGLTLVASTN